jgi:hypothetical protein
VALGRSSLFFKTDIVFDKRKGGGSLRSDTFEMSVNNVSFDDTGKVSMVDLTNKNYKDIYYGDILRDKGSKQNRVYIMGELTYNEARETIDHICEGNN